MRYFVRPVADLGRDADACSPTCCYVEVRVSCIVRCSVVSL